MWLAYCIDRLCIIFCLVNYDQAKYIIHDTICIPCETTLVSCRLSQHSGIQLSNDCFVVGLVWFMVFNTTLNNILAISWRSVLLVEETGVTWENRRPVARH